MYWLTQATLRNPRLTAVVLLATTVAFCLGLPKLHSEYGYRPLLGGSHPSIEKLEEFIEIFGGGFPLLIVWECGPKHPCSTALDSDSLAMAFEVERSLERVKGIRAIRGPATTSLMVPNRDGFSLRRFVEEGIPVSDAAELAERAIRDPLWKGNLVSDDGLVGAITVVVVDAKSATMVPVVAAVQEAIAPFEEQGFSYALAGHPIESVIPGMELEKSTAFLTPFVAAIVALIIFGLTRSWQAVAITMGSMGLALLWTFGALGWLDWPQDSVLQVLPNLILFVGVCDAIHLLSRQAAILSTAEDTAGPSRDGRTRAILGAAREVAWPCVMTTLTTAGAFLSFVTSDLATFGRFGLISAFSVGACLVVTFSLIPLLLVWLPPSGARAVRQTRAWDVTLRAIADTAQVRAIPILVATAIVFAVCLVGWIGYLRVDTDINRMWGEHSQVTRWIRFVDNRLRGLDTLEIDIHLPPTSRVEEPTTQAALADFISHLESTEGLGRATSVRNLMASFNRALHDDDPTWERTGDSAMANGEILELISFDDPQLLGNWLSLDRSRVRISVEGPSDSARGRGKVLESVQAYVAGELPADWEVHFTGPFAMEYDWVDQLQDTQIRSFATAFLIVFVLTAFFLRSVRLGFAAIVPAAVPVVVILGIMGFAGQLLDVGRAMVAAIVIGIAVDDSLHLLTHYRRRRDAGDDPSEAIRASILQVGRAIIVTSTAVALGALALVLSAWQTVSSFGFFVSIALIGALVASLFVLPATIFAFQRGKSPPVEERVESEKPVSAPSASGLMLLVLLLPTVAFTGASLWAVGRSSGAEIPCWVSGNGRVITHPLSDARCPLRLGDELLSVEGARAPPSVTDDLSSLLAALEEATDSVEVVLLRDGERFAMQIPVYRTTAAQRLARVAAAGLTAAALLFLPSVLLRRSSSPAAAPLALFYAAVSTVVIIAIGARDSVWLQRWAVFAAVSIPATLAHLALNFPHQRSFIRARPRLSAIPYVGAAVLLPPAWLALGRYPGYAPTITMLILATTLGAWIVLILSCAFAARDARFAVERARARSLLTGLIVLPCGFTIFAALRGEGELLVTFLMSALVLMPVPIAYAISRYDLFELGFDVRVSMTQALYYAIGAFLLTAALSAGGVSAGGGGATGLFALLLTGLFILEKIRGRFLRMLEGLMTPWAVRHRALREQFIIEVGPLRDQDEVARLLGDTLLSSLDPEAGCVFLHSAEEWRPAHPFGNFAQGVGSMLSRGATIDRPAEPIMDPGPPTHRNAGSLARPRWGDAELVLPIEAAGEVLGQVALLRARNGLPFSGEETEFAMILCKHAGTALENARLARRLVVAEGRAATGRTALALFHRMAKELDWLRQIADRLPSLLVEPDRVKQDIATIGEMSEGLSDDLRAFMHSATAQSDYAEGMANLDSLVLRAIQRVEKTQGEACVLYEVSPATSAAVVHENIEVVLVTLLENALAAVQSGASVQVSATVQDDGVELTVSDRGEGMSPELQRRAFRLGFTTRARDGGTGVGLSIAREIIESMGGSIALDSHLGRGTTATMRVPHPS